MARLYVVCLIGLVCSGIQAQPLSTGTKLLSTQDLQKAGLDPNINSSNGVLAIIKAAWSIPDYEPTTNWTIDAATNLDINGDGIRDVVALINLQCTCDPAEVFVAASKDGQTYVAQRFTTCHAMMERTLRDLDKDGKYEILIDTVIQGETSCASAFWWIDIYSWTGDRFSINSGNFLQSFYLTEYTTMISSRSAYAVDQLRHLPGTTDEGDSYRREALGMLDDCRFAISNVVALSKQPIKTTER